MGLSINLLSWQYKLISTGLPGYALLINYLSSISVGVILLIANTIILITSFILVGKTSGIKGVFGYVLLSIVIDKSREILFLHQFTTPPFFISALLIGLQGLIAPIGISLVLVSGYSFGSYSSIIPIVKKFSSISSPKLFLILDLFLAMITYIFFGINSFILVLVNAIVFYFSFKYFLNLFSKITF